MIAGLFLLVVLGGLAWAVGQWVQQNRDGAPGAPGAPGAAGRHRADARESAAQLFRLGLLLAAIAIVAEGLVGVVAELLPRGDELVGDESGLARALAFLVVGIPALGALGTWSRRRLQRDPDEAGSAGWAAYLTVAEVLGLIVALPSLHIVLRGLAGAGAFDPEATARAVVWSGVWAVHARWNRRRAPRAGHTPTALLIGSALGWVLTAVAAGQTVAEGLRVLYDRAFTDVLAFDGGTSLRRSAVSLLIGAAVWSWYWLRHAARSETTVAWSAYVLLLGSLGSLVAAVIGTATAGYTVLQWFFGDGGAPTAAAHFASLPGSTAAALVGVTGWAYHHGLVRRSAAGPRRDVHRVADYLPAAVGLVTLAVAVVSSIAALLGALASTGALAGGDAIAGEDVIRAITLIAVGAPVWGRFWWRAQRFAGSQAELRSTPRRLYLIVLFGVAAVVALGGTLSLLVVLFEDIGDGVVGRGTLHDLRIPIGLVLSTAVVAGYHATIFRRDRRLTAPATPVTRLREVLVLGPQGDGAAEDPAALLADRLRRELGAPVRVLAVRSAISPVAEVAAALAAADAPAAVVVVRPDGTAEVHTGRYR